MRVDCEGCAGCCIDWRPLTDADIDHERRGSRQPLDETSNLVPLTRSEVRAFVDRGHGDALTPRLFADDDGVTIDGHSVAAIDGRPAFYVGLRKPPKSVAPFDADPTWLETCVFLDPVTLQCRLHDGELYPDTCGAYPGENLSLAVETECERVEAHAPGEAAGERLSDDEPPADATPLLGPAALGSKLFAHPEPERLSGVVSRLVADELTAADRAEFVAVAAASAPGTGAVSDDWYERYRERARDAASWTGRAIERWQTIADAVGEPAPEPECAREIEDDDGAPPTPGWDSIDDTST
ncbi:YkgJ family cysteine cluster protein [Halomicrobium mukohataei]|uniref:YkgJ family cysteine cluster protein n=1 Tax=Halomicrobium mukohataei TaxID=57705 RepID=A0A847UB83_9EURY|nr:YkgJ family cysteine cluster protein [Halomicrobium mukohataei]NLV09497.1 YkgJ family cysteine cluster protein [Halomicrobium mukohataei]